MKKNELTQPQRQRTSVAIQGLDKNSPDDIVKDGACSILRNVRFKDNAWRPVCGFKGIKYENSSIVHPSIIYRHPIANNGEYITMHTQLHLDGTVLYVYSIFNINTGEYKDITSLDNPAKLSHFGNILFFNNAAYIYNNGGYSIVDIYGAFPSIDYTNHISTAEYIQPNYFQLEEGSTLGNFIPSRWYPIHRLESFLTASNGQARLRFLWQLHNGWYWADEWVENPFPTSKDGYWSGEYAMFAVLRMNDGTYINPSPIILNPNRNDYTMLQGCIVGDLGDAYLSDEEPDFSLQGTGLISKWITPVSRDKDTILSSICYENFFTTTVKVTLPSNIDTSLIHSVAIFASPNYPMLDYTIIKNLPKVEQEHPLNNFYQDNNLLSNPFFNIHEVDIADIPIDASTNTRFFEYDISASTFEKLTDKLAYTPNSSAMMHANIRFDYNNSLHLADTVTTLNDEFFSGMMESPSEESGITHIGVITRVNGENIEYWSDKHYGKGINDKCSLLISIHDSSATNIMFKRNVVNAETGDIIETVINVADMEQATENNFAYFHNKPTAEFRYPPINIHSFPEHNNTISAKLRSRTNHIQVSAPNNCFNFPFDNSYYVGSQDNHILALQSAALEMSDTKFGEFPLYAFTTEGIFALQTGKETTYSNVIPINYDKIINPNTLAINGAIVYITEKGVHLLTNEGSAIISTPIHNADGIPPLDFLRDCKIIWPKQYNEVVLQKDGNSQAYVYNIDAKYWYTRDLSGTKINTDEIIYNNTIYDLSDEDESQPLRMTIKTRPIKLGNTEFKRLETIIPRMNTGNNDILTDITVSGSLDGVNYDTLRKVRRATITAPKVNPLVLRRTPFSAKYFECYITLEPAGNTKFNPTITHIDFEWYERFGRRMR